MCTTHWGKVNTAFIEQTHISQNYSNVSQELSQLKNTRLTQADTVYFQSFTTNPIIKLSKCWLPETRMRQIHSHSVSFSSFLRTSHCCRRDIRPAGPSIWADMAPLVFAHTNNLTFRKKNNRSDSVSVFLSLQIVSCDKIWNLYKITQGLTYSVLVSKCLLRTSALMNYLLKA